MSRNCIVLGIAINKRTSQMCSRRGDRSQWPMIGTLVEDEENVYSLKVCCSKNLFIKSGLQMRGAISNLFCKQPALLTTIYCMNSPKAQGVEFASAILVGTYRKEKLRSFGHLFNDSSTTIHVYNKINKWNYNLALPIKN